VVSGEEITADGAKFCPVTADETEALAAAETTVGGADMSLSLGVRFLHGLHGLGVQFRFIQAHMLHGLYEYDQVSTNDHGLHPLDAAKQVTFSN
jgi:hypothetical protein